MRNFIIALSCLTFICAQESIQTDVKWEESYSFNKSNVFKIEFYAKNNELMMTTQHKIYFKNGDDNFDVQYQFDKKYGNEVLMDKKNNVAIQIMSKGTSMESYNAGGFKYPTGEDLKKLEVVPTNETKQILNYTCKKYTIRFFRRCWRSY